MITTITLNPAFDVHVTVDEFYAGHENLAETVTRCIGGKGINISRALYENDIENTALVLLGIDNSIDFTNSLEKSGLSYKTVECNGRIRENITIHHKNGNETRLSFKGFSCDYTHLEKIEKLIGASDFVTFTGSIPIGITSAQAEAFLEKLKKDNTRLIIDSKSVTLEMLNRIKPWLIKPNREEIEAYFGKSEEKQLYKYAMKLHRNGIENVMISLGPEGAILASSGKLYHAYPPRINAVSTIGAGDSAIAGFISCNSTPDIRLRTAVSFGTAACLRDGTNPPSRDDIQKIHNRVKIEIVKDYP